MWESPDFWKMAADLLRDNPELRPFVLSNVQLSGTRIGAGAYASVEEVTIPVCGAAKKIHDIFQDRSEIPDDDILKASASSLLMLASLHLYIGKFSCECLSCPVLCLSCPVFSCECLFLVVTVVSNTSH